jgi:hypothetical protein
MGSYQFISLDIARYVSCTFLYWGPIITDTGAPKVLRHIGGKPRVPVCSGVHEIVSQNFRSQLF